MRYVVIAITLALLLAPACQEPTPCGNGILDPGEECDGLAADIDVAPCASWVCDECGHATECWAVWPCTESCTVDRGLCPVACVDASEWEAGP